MFSAEQAAEYLGGGGISAETVKRLARQKKIGHVKVGRVTVFPRKALDAYIEAHTVQPELNAWGLTDGAARTIREGSPRDRVRRRGEHL